jgi:uncharacterized membrane protein
MMAFATHIFLPVLHLIQLQVGKNDSSAFADNLALVSHYNLLAGLLASIPAIITGFAQLYDIIKKHGEYFEADGKTVKPKIKAMIMHSLLIYAVVAGSGLLFWGSHRIAKKAGRYGTEVWMQILSVGLTGTLVFAANLGMKAVYVYGVGVGRASDQGKKAE